MKFRVVLVFGVYPNKPDHNSVIATNHRFSLTLVNGFMKPLPPRRIKMVYGFVRIELHRDCFFIRGRKATIVRWDQPKVIVTIAQLVPRSESFPKQESVVASWYPIDVAV